MRHRVRVLAVVVLSACSIGRGSAAPADCQLSEVSGAATAKDVLTSVAPSGVDVIAVGTRFKGSSGLVLTAGGTRDSWDARLIPVFGTRVVEMDDVGSEPGGGAWAVGAMTAAAPAVAHFTGTTWTATAVADPGSDEDGLSGVAAVSRGLAWAVGRHQEGEIYQPLIERWDGTEWLRVPGPRVDPSAMLKDVATSGPDDAWAVGWRVVDGSYRTLIERWDGTAWTVVPTPALGTGDAILSGVTAVDPNDAWAVGWVTSRTGELRPVVERWDGRTWSVVALPDLGPAAFAAVTATRDGVVAVGRSNPAGRPSPLAIRYEAGSWSTIPITTSQPAQGSLAGVTVDRAGSVWAVGSQLTSDGLAASLVVSGCGPA